MMTGRILVTSAAALIAIFAVPGAAFAQYGGGGGSTGSGGTGGAPSGGAGGAGNGLTLSLSSSELIAGGTEIVSLGAGPCTPGGLVSVSAILTLPGEYPISLGTTSASSSGGFGAVDVTIPQGSVPGVYVLFSTCTGPDGFQAVTSAFVIEPADQSLADSSGALGALVASTSSVNWQPPSSYLNPLQREVIAQAVNSRIGSILATDAAALTVPAHSAVAAPTVVSGPERKVASSAASSVGNRKGHSSWISRALISAGGLLLAVILASVGIVTLRRRHA